MTKRYLSQLVLITLISLIGLSVFGINPYLMVFLMVIAFGIVIYDNDRNYQIKVRQDNLELTNRVRSTSNDAHLKHKQLVTLVSNIPLPLLLIDAEGKIVMYNEQFEIFKESKQSEALTYSQNDFKTGVHEFVFDAYLMESIRQKAIEDNGQHYEAISVPVYSNKVYSGCVILFQDISRIKEREEMQKQFIADASHELKTPIAAIKGMVEILNREDFDDEATRKDFLIQIEKENERLEQIVLGLLELSKLNRDTLVLQRNMIDFTQIADSCANSFKETMKKEHITLVRDYQSHKPVFVDAAKMTIVINNLLSNAIKYSGAGSIITLKSLEAGDCYIFSITDTGKGIAAEELAKIFERFYRIDKDRARFSGGIGIGLSIVKSIIDAHDAKISVKSELNSGTTFVIELYY